MNVIVRAVDYSKSSVPESYRCSWCGGTECKLLRDKETITKNIVLTCAMCLGREEFEKAELSGKSVLIPAVPTPNSPRSFFLWDNVPEEAIAWWNRLPTYPSERALPAE